MAVYMVERVLPGATIDQLVHAQRAVVEMSQRFTARGEPIQYLRGNYIPVESRVLSWFEALDFQTVQELNEVVGMPYVRIIEVVDLSAEK